MKRLCLLACLSCLHLLPLYSSLLDPQSITHSTAHLPVLTLDYLLANCSPSLWSTQRSQLEGEHGKFRLLSSSEMSALLEALNKDQVIDSS